MAKNRLKRPFISKQIRKKAAGCCHICGEDNYAALEVHRIKHGEHGGKYSYDNTVSLCGNCHAKHHAGVIKVIGWFESTAGRLLNYIDEQGDEQFL